MKTLKSFEKIHRNLDETQAIIIYTHDPKQVNRKTERKTKLSA